MPLTDNERRTLMDIEKRLITEDPGLARVLSPATWGSAARIAGLAVLNACHPWRRSVAAAAVGAFLVFLAVSGIAPVVGLGLLGVLVIAFVKLVAGAKVKSLLDRRRAKGFPSRWAEPTAPGRRL